MAAGSAGTLHLPVAAGAGPGSGRHASDLAQSAGADLVHGLPSVAHWLTGLDGPLVLGNYVYADGATNVRVAMAVDALSVELLKRRDDVALAFLATPTDVFAVPGAAVDFSTRAYRSPSAAMRVLRPALRTVSGGRLLQRNYAPGGRPRPQRQPCPAAGAQLRARQAAAAMACHGRSPRRRDGVPQRRATDADAFGRQEPRPRLGLRRRPPVRHRGLRTGHEQHPDGRPARARPAFGSRAADPCAVARRG